MTIAHVLLTRFNLPSEGAESFVRAQEGWLRDRIELFETYTVPSVRAQTEPVHWIVYVDEKSPPWLLDRLGPLQDEGLMALLGRQEVPKGDLLRDIQMVLPSQTTRVITTNLDNDDGLAGDFSARVRVAAESAGPAAIYVDNGLVATASQVYLHRDDENAFCSAVSDCPVTLTCWEDWHNRLRFHMPVRHVTGPPGWLQTIHTGNVSNRVRGRLASPRRYEGLFPGLLSDVPEPTRRELTHDAWLGAPWRAIRDGIRFTTREAVVRLVGKDRFNAIKARLAAWRRV